MARQPAAVAVTQQQDMEVEYEQDRPTSAIARIRALREQQERQLQEEKQALIREVCDGIMALNAMGEEFNYSLRYGIKSIDLQTGEVIEPKTNGAAKS